MLMNKSITANATCNVTTTTADGKEQSVAVMAMSGTLNTNGKFSVNRRVDSPDLYKVNKSEMDADAAAFETMLLSALE